MNVRRKFPPQMNTDKHGLRPCRARTRIVKSLNRVALGVPDCRPLVRRQFFDFLRGACPFFRPYPCLSVSICGLFFVLTLLCVSNASSVPLEDRTTVVLVVGAPGEAEYASNFLAQTTLWQKACAQADARTVTLGMDSASATNDFDSLKQTLADEPKDGLGQLWLVLIGHGTFDGKEARFNLRGPDVSATDLAIWLQPFRRPLAVINNAACSGPFLNKLSATNRVIITATRSGNEQNYARFGQFFAKALTDPQADLDQDGQVSLLRHS